MSSNKNASLLNALSSKADTLACGAAKNKFPVLLQSIAKRRRVTSVEFCPLLVDAMLTTHPQGFRILFDSDHGNPSDLRGQYENESGERMLSPRLRFSLAHELAHTFFYDLSDEAPKISKQFRSGGGKTALENLERYCNKLAAHLLLPMPMLSASFHNIKTINPKSILELAKNAGVSVDVLIRHLADNSRVFIDRYFRGCIVLIKQKGDAVSVSAVAKPIRLNIARDLRQLRRGEHWQLTTFDGTPIDPQKLPVASHATLTVEISPGVVSKQRYQIGASSMRTSDSTISYLLTFEEADTSDPLSL